MEQFHGQSELLVQQELSAHFSLVAMIRLFTSHIEAGYRTDPGKPTMQANFRTGLRAVGQHLEGLFLQYAATLGEMLRQILGAIAPCRQWRRPNRLLPTRPPASRPANGGPASLPRPPRRPDGRETRREPPEIPLSVN